MRKRLEVKNHQIQEKLQTCKGEPANTPYNQSLPTSISHWFTNVPKFPCLSSLTITLLASNYLAPAILISRSHSSKLHEDQTHPVHCVQAMVQATYCNQYAYLLFENHEDEFECAYLHKLTDGRISSHCLTGGLCSKLFRSAGKNKIRNVIKLPSYK